MNNLFTERFSEYLNRNGYTDNSGTFVPSVPEDCRKLFEHFPSIVIDETLTINLYDMFIQDNAMKEIGAETEQMFTYYLRRTLDEALIIYVPKINIFIENYNKELMSRKVKLVANTKNTYNLTYQTDSTSTNANSDFLNPAIEDSLKIQAKTKNEATDNETRGQTGTVENTGDREQAYSWFKSNPQILEEIMKIKHVYIEALRYFDKLFMYVL